MVESDQERLVEGTSYKLKEIKYDVKIEENGFWERTTEIYAVSKTRKVHEFEHYLLPVDSPEAPIFGVPDIEHLGGKKVNKKADKAERRISIEVTGEQKRDYFSILRKTIRDINKDFQKLEIQELVPLPGFKNEYVDYKELIGHEMERKDELFIGKLRKNF